MARTTTLEATPEMARLRAEINALDERLPRYPWAMLYLVMFGATIEAFDRSLFGIVLEDIRRAFDATDYQLGFAAGAFGFVATLGVIPLGYLTDRVKRVRIISWGYLPWGIGMILQGLSTSFPFFFLARMFNGTLEATNGQEAPAPVSLIGDWYPVEERNRAFGLQGLGQIAGYAAGPIFGGISAAAFGWRGAFIMWGCIGFGTGLILRALLVEPPRGMQDAKYRLQSRYMELRLAQRRATFGEDTPVAEIDVDEEIAKEKAAAVALEAAELARLAGGGVKLNTFDYRTLTTQDATRQLMRIKSFWVLTFYGVLGVFASAGVATWIPTFYRRYHGMSVTGSSVVQAFIAASSLLGVYGGARLGTAVVKAGKGHWRLYICAGSTFVTASMWMIAMTTSFTPFSIHFFIYGAIAATTPIGLVLALRTDLIHPYLRGRAFSLSAIPRIGATLIAPITFGIVSDLAGLRTAMLIMCPIYFTMGTLLIVAARWYSHDIAYSQAESIRQHIIEEAERAEGGDAEVDVAGNGTLGH
jgi:MFS family permease